MKKVQETNSIRLLYPCLCSIADCHNITRWHNDYSSEAMILAVMISFHIWSISYIISTKITVIHFNQSKWNAVFIRSQPQIGSYFSLLSSFDYLRSTQHAISNIQCGHYFIEGLPILGFGFLFKWFFLRVLHIFFHSNVIEPRTGGSVVHQAVTPEVESWLSSLLG